MWMLTLLLAASPQSPLAQGEAALDRQDWAGAEKDFREAIVQNSKDHQAWLGLGIALDHLDKSPQAARAYQASLSLRETPQAWHNLGFIVARGGDVEAARGMFEKAVAVDPGYWRGWTALSKANEELGDLPDALLAAARAQKLRPDDPAVTSRASSLRDKLAAAGVDDASLVHYYKGTAAASAGQDGAAKDELEKAISEAPKFADAHYNLGIVLRRAGDLAGAEKEYRAAIDAFGSTKSANRADAQNNLADLIVASGGKAQEARALAAAAIAVRGERPGYLDTLARACDAIKDASCARDAFRKLVDSKADVPAAVRAHAAERLRALGQ